MPTSEPTPSPAATPTPEASPGANQGPTASAGGTDTESQPPAAAPGAAPPPSGPQLSETDESAGLPPGGGLAPIAQPDPVGPAPDRPALAPTALGPLDFLGGFVTGAIGNVGLIIRPDAAIAVATEFTFPLALAIAVLLFLVVQDQVDRRDPKLRAAPKSQGDTFIRFEAEEAQ